MTATISDISGSNRKEDFRFIEDTFTQLNAYFATGATHDYPWRVQQLRQLDKMIVEHQLDIQKALAADLGKCEMEAWISEIGYLQAEIKHTIKHLKGWMRPRKVSSPLLAQPGKSYLKPDPLGVVLIIGAWNYPFQLVLAPLIAAIAAGNCAILKPSELSVATSALIAKLVPQYLDNKAVAVIEGGKDETTEILKLPFAHSFYTGGEAVGKIVMRAAAEHLTPVTLELGGKSPCIVDSNTNLAVTAQRIVWAKWMNAGQTCVAPDYVLVKRDFVEPLVDAIKAKLIKQYGNDPHASKDYGRIVNERHCARLASYLEGQNVVHGGEVNTDERYIAPTIVQAPDATDPVMTEEIFGPILPIIPVDSMDDAIAFVNQRAKPLAMYIFTHDSHLEQRILDKTSAGSVCINDGFMFMVNSELPFGGVGHSGMGSYHGKWGFDTFSHLKSVMKRSFWFDLDVRYAPFNKTKLSLLKKLQ
ncbi:aldehyde dehydrogenase family protein [Alteromonas facilis]|uniref:aldehyde dehydrogenase family protein n=1 Tax=Alteromonas facilis TaxID=2048004 RepID=UPI000C28789C|nr:aldehyde dehydrogenase family protein [Alteromonas facilis]